MSKAEMTRKLNQIDRTLETLAAALEKKGYMRQAAELDELVDRLEAMKDVI